MKTKQCSRQQHPRPISDKGEMKSFGISPPHHTHPLILSLSGSSRGQNKFSFQHAQIYEDHIFGELGLAREKRIKWIYNVDILYSISLYNIYYINTYMFNDFYGGQLPLLVLPTDTSLKWI